MSRTRFRLFLAGTCLVVIAVLLGLGAVVGNQLSSVPHYARQTATRTASSVATSQLIARLDENAAGSCRRANERTTAENRTSDGAYRGLAATSRLVGEVSLIERDPAIARLQRAYSQQILDYSDEITYLPPIDCHDALRHPLTYQYPRPISYRAHLAEVEAQG